MTAERKCPKCGAQLSPDTLEGLCPKCLLEQSTDPTNIIPSGPDGQEAEEGGTPGFTPPSLEDMSGLFPQLEILELLGKGGMGAVYKARQTSLDRLVALKVLPSTVAKDPSFAERFSREAKALAKLNHPNIVMVHDFGQAGDLYYFLMEFVDGVDLRQTIKAGELQPGAALKIVTQICDALQFAHEEGVVHRDIKPENILLDKKGHVKIADFGLAKLVGPARADFTLTSAGQVMGTPHYMAPEQMEKPMEVDQRADIYSLGVVFYEMLTGELPLGRFAPPSQKVQVDVRLDEVVLRSLEREPDRRYQKVSEVKTQVESIADTSQAETPAPPSSETKLCKLPIIGLITIPLGLLFLSSVPAFMLLGEVAGKEEPFSTVFNRTGLGLVLLISGVPFLFFAVVSSFVGFVGISRIRRSEGSLTGTGLAVVVALFYPIFVPNIILLGLVVAGLPLGGMEILLLLIVLALADIAIIWAAWKHVSKPLPGASVQAEPTARRRSAAHKVIVTVAVAALAVVAVAATAIVLSMARGMRTEGRGDEGFVFEPSGPTVSRELAQTLDLRPMEAKEVNKAIREAHKKYLPLEAKHADVSKDEKGHVHVKVTPFSAELKAIQDRLWSKVDAVLDERQRAVARRHLPLRQIFPYGDMTSNIEIWRKGLQYHWKEEAKGQFRSSSSSGSSTDLQHQYKRFWEEAHKAEKRKTYFVSPSGTDRNPGTEKAPFRSIQFAINNAKPGGQIVVRGGTYAESIQINKPLRLDGKAGEKVVLTNPGEYGIRITSDNVKVANIAVTGCGKGILIRKSYVGNAPEGKLRNVTIDHVTIEKSSFGIYVVMCENLTVTNCTLSDLSADGIWVSFLSDNAEISNNRLTHIGDQGIWLGGHFQRPDVYANNGRIVGNTIANVRESGIIYSGEKCLIKGNTVTGVKGEGYSVGAISLLGHVAKDVQVVDNVIHDNLTAGIGVKTKAESILVRGNQIYNNKGPGLDNKTDEVIDARENWWGDPTGPADPKDNPKGKGQKVVGKVTCKPWCEEEK